MRSRRLTSTLPEDLTTLLTRIGQDLSVARRIRRMSQEDLAQRLNASRRLVTRMEKGDPTVSFGAYAMAAWLMGLTKNLEELFSQDRDPVFQREARLAVPRKVRKKSGADESLDF